MSKKSKISFHSTSRVSIDERGSSKLIDCFLAYMRIHRGIKASLN